LILHTVSAGIGRIAALEVLLACIVNVGIYNKVKVPNDIIAVQFIARIALNYRLVSTAWDHWLV
jgi:hypothetical protein